MSSVSNIIIQIAAVITAVVAIGSFLFSAFRWYLKQEEQDKEIVRIKENHKEEIAQIKKEDGLICFALSACLDGLMQLGANHTVPVAKDKLDKYLNEQAHK